MAKNQSSLVILPDGIGDCDAGDCCRHVLVCGAFMNQLDPKEIAEIIRRQEARRANDFLIDVDVFQYDRMVDAFKAERRLKQFTELLGGDL